MARSQATDFFHAMKFQVVVATGGITGASEIQGGFATATVPEQNLEAVEYKEGIYLYRRKFVGDVTFSDVTLTKGIAKADTAFWRWLNAALTGEEYRVDIQMRHFHRDELTGLNDFTQANALRTYNLFEAMPIRVKAAGDFDAQSSEISLQEIDIAFERFTVEDNHSPAVA